jgi:hypothetical protein
MIKDGEEEQEKNSLLQEHLKGLAGKFEEMEK